VLTLSACSGSVDVEVPALDAEQRAACQALLEALPERLEDVGEDGLDPVGTDPADAPAAAYGDPAVVVTCGVPRPEAYDRFAICQEIDGVGWFAPEEQIGDEPTEVTLTAVGYRPRVQVVVPAEYWPMGAPSVTAALAAPVRDSVDLVNRCR
jgi:hypothetical protein